MVRKTLMSLLIVGSMAVVPMAYAEGSYESGTSSGSSSSDMGSGTSSGSSSSDMGSGSSGMGSSSTGSSAYERECITAAQKRTQHCMDLQKSESDASGASGPSSSGSSDTSSGMGSGSSTTSPTVP